LEQLHDLDFIIPILIGVFFAILFLQSALDKIFDWSGNLAWLKGHFEKSFLKSMVPVLLGTLTVIELLAGVLSVYGIIAFLIHDCTFWLEQGVIVSIISLLMLFFGQRIAKDYEGAKTIAIYFGVALVCCVYFLGISNL